MAHQETPPDRKTMIGTTKPSKTEGRMTRTMAVSSESTTTEGHMGKGDTRKIVGILITFTWQPQGQMFSVREGKNFIGSDKVYSEASHQDCDVQIKQDVRMSGEHALILCRSGKDELKYELLDKNSSNGTFVNGEMLSALGAQELQNYSEIKAGSTLFTFIKVKAPEGEEHVSLPPKTKEPKTSEPEDNDKKDTIVR
ncbi:MAG: FHA domain-containing protein [Desulfobulbaceae bacterium]|nr:FHA domain-containing protein [Desulfobulbaceae bacterium]